jgi:hypothetical protein
MIFIREEVLRILEVLWFSPLLLLLSHTDVQSAKLS